MRTLKLSKIPCQHCGKLISTRNTQFCSRRCSNAHHPTPVLVADQKTRQKASASKSVSPKTGHKIEMVCEHCGEKFLEYPSKRPQPLKFCTRACYLAFAKLKNGGRREADSIFGKAPKKAEPGMSIVYDPTVPELRNE